MTEAFPDGQAEISQAESLDPMTQIDMYYASLHADRRQIETELRDANEQKRVAEREAGQPFQARITGLAQGLEAVKERQDPENARHAFEAFLDQKSAFYKNVADLLISDYFGTIPYFLQRVADAQVHEWDRKSINSFTSTINGIMNFTEKLRTAAEPQPVAVYGIRRWEERDEQAEWEGRDSSTGIFHDSLFGYQGLVTVNSLKVQKSHQVLPDQVGYIRRPEELVLELSDAEILHEKPPTYDFANFDREITSQGKLRVALLSRKKEDERTRRKFAPVAWDKEPLQKDKNLKVALGAEAIAAVTAQWAER